MTIDWRKTAHGWYDAYTSEGNKLKVPSVTTIVNFKEDPELDSWIEKVGQEEAERILKSAAQRGSVMHYYLENYYRAVKLKGDCEKALLYSQRKTLIQAKSQGIQDIHIKTGRQLFYQLFQSQMQEEIQKILSLEKKLTSFKHVYRGKYDINYMTRDSKNIIADFKTSSSRVEEGSTKERKYKLQLAGYWQAYEENFPDIKLDYAKLWIAVKDGSIQEILIGKEEKQDCLEEFLELCKKYHEAIGQSLNS